jgi:RNA polymerase sigma-70 factor (ECF subfamily)
MSDTRVDYLQTLLDRMAAGNEAAREALLGHAYERLKQLARRSLGKFPGVRRIWETGDVANNVYLRLKNALRELALQGKSPPTVEAFLGLAAQHTRWELLNLASNRREPDPIGPAPTDTHTTAPGLDPPHGSAGPSTLAEWAEVHSAIARLPNQDRTMFDLIYYGGLTQAEAAAALGVDVRTVKRHWQRARLALKHEMKGQFPSL